MARLPPDSPASGASEYQNPGCSLRTCISLSDHYGVRMSANTKPVTAPRPSGEAPRRLPTSKVTAATLAAAIASIAFILLGKFAPSAFTDTQLAALQGSVTTVLAFVLGYLPK